MKLTKDILRQLIKEEIHAASAADILGEKKNKNKRRRRKDRQRSAKRQQFEQQFEELKEKFVETGTESVLLGAEARAIIEAYGEKQGRPAVLKIYAQTLELDKETQKMRDDNPELEAWLRSEEGQAELAQVRDLEEKRYEERLKFHREYIRAQQAAAEAEEWEKNRHAMSRRQPWY